MTLEPDYGGTPVPGDELEFLRPSARALLEEPVTKAAIYDLEQGVQDQVAAELFADVMSGELSLDSLLTDHFVRSLHLRMFGDIWTWAGLYRLREMNIGVPPAEIPTAVRTSLDDIRYRWEQTQDWDPQQLGIAVHAELVRVHPFTDGNGRSSRLTADLVFASTQVEGIPHQYDWNLDKRQYIELLRRYDRHRDPTELASFITTQPMSHEADPDQV